MFGIVKFFETFPALSILFDEYFLNGKLLIKDRDYEEIFGAIALFEDIESGCIITKKTYILGVLKSVEHWQSVHFIRTSTPIRLVVI